MSNFHFIESLKVFGPLVLALFVFIVYENFNKKGKINFARENGVKNIESLVSILLPLVVLNVARKTQVSGLYWYTFGIGFMLPIVAYISTMMISKNKFFSEVFDKDNKFSQLLLSSFGGGNRGNLLVLTAFGATTGIGSDVIKHFIILDLGNLLCMLLLIFYYLEVKTENKNKHRFFEIVGKFSKNPIIYVILFLVSPISSWPSVVEFFSKYDHLLNKIGSFTGFAFSFFIFMTIFLRMEKLSSGFLAASDIIFTFCASRSVISVLVALLIYIFSLPAELLIAVLLLLIMPPSSLLWAKISQIQPGWPKKGSRANAVYLAPNAVFLMALALAFLWRVKDM